MSLLWVNGTLVEKTDARVSPFDHGFLYGDGISIPLRVYAGLVYGAEVQVRHLFAAAVRLGLDVPFAPHQLANAVEATVHANHRTNGYVRVIVTRGPGTLGPDPRKILPQVMIVAEEYQPFPLELYQHGLHAVGYPVPIDPETALWRERVLGQPHLALAKRYALQHGCLEALLFDHAGGVLGTTEGTVLVVKDNVVRCSGWHPPDVLVQRVADLLSGCHVTFEEALTTRPDLAGADELLLVGTSCGVIGLIRFDDRPIGTGGPGPVTKLVQERFRPGPS